MRPLEKRFLKTRKAFFPSMQVTVQNFPWESNSPGSSLQTGGRRRWAQENDLKSPVDPRLDDLLTLFFKGVVILKCGDFRMAKASAE